MMIRLKSLSRSQNGRLLDCFKIYWNPPRELCSGRKDNSQNKPVEPGESIKEMPVNKPKGGFVEAMAKFEGHESFTKMLRKSPLVQVYVQINGACMLCMH